MTKKKVKTFDNFWERNRKSNGYLLQKRIMGVLISICRFFLLFGMCFLIIQPILNKISVSFMTESDLYNPVVTSIPIHFTTENYKLAASADLMNYSKSIVNSLVVSVTIAILQISVCTLVGYGFARFKFPLKSFWFACVLMTILVPPQVISNSLFLNFQAYDIGIFLQLFTGKGIIAWTTGHTINLKGSSIPYYLMSAGCMGLKNGLYIYMIRQFFRNIPVDLEEAAYVDGCGTLKTFLRIMLPEAKPILTSCFLFSFVWQWTDGFYSKMFLGKIDLLSVKLARLVDSLGAYLQRIWGSSNTVSVAYSNCILATGTLMIIVPLIIIYLFAQRAFVESIASTGIKM